MSLVDGTTPTPAAADAAILSDSTTTSDNNGDDAIVAGTDSSTVTDGNLPIEAALGDSSATFYALVPSNVVDLQVTGNDGQVHEFRLVVDHLHGDAVYGYVNGAPGLVVFHFSQIAGLSVLS